MAPGLQCAVVGHENSNPGEKKGCAVSVWLEASPLKYRHDKPTVDVLPKPSLLLFGRRRPPKSEKQKPSEGHVALSASVSTLWSQICHWKGENGFEAGIPFFGTSKSCMKGARRWINVLWANPVRLTTPFAMKLEGGGGEGLYGFRSGEGGAGQAGRNLESGCASYVLNMPPLFLRSTIIK